MIHRQEGYVLKKIREVSVLLPFGQAVADQKRGITLNETGVFLWKELERPGTRQSLTEKLLRYCQAGEENREAIGEDVEYFIKQLLELGILREDLKPAGEPLYGFMEIAGFSVKLLGQAAFFSEAFTPFLTENKSIPDMEIEIINGIPNSRQTGQILVHNPDMTICSWENGYVAKLHKMKNIVEAYMTEDGRYVRFYCLQQGDCKQEQENIFHGIRLFFLYFAQKKGCMAVHSASLLYGGRAWLFSGQAGAGKSTHTRLWKETLGVLELNGDLNLIGKAFDGTWTVYGIPWCGTSGISTVKAYPLGGIVLLEQAAKDQAEELFGYRKVLRVMQRMISPSWTEQLMTRNLSFAQEMAEEIPVFQLKCTKNPSAVDVIKEQIDDWEVRL